MDAGQGPSIVYTGVDAAGCAAVAVLALRVPVALRDAPVMVPLPWGGRARLDLLCLPAAAAGLVLLAAARDPGIGMAVTVSVATDAVLYVPTIAHAWQHPEHESWAAYGLFGLGAWLALAAAATGGDAGSTAAVEYPWYLAVANTGVTAMILTRRSVTATPGRAGPPGSGQVQNDFAAGEPQLRLAAVHHDLLAGNQTE